MPGHNNWFNTTLSTNSNNSQIPFEVTFNLSGELETNFHKASDQAAQLLASNYSNIHLCLSGGLDSEYVAKVLLRNNISFTPVVTLINDTSQIEYEYAKDFCRQHNLTPVVFDYRNRLDDLCKQLFAEAFQIYVEPNIGLVTHVIANQLPGAALLTGFGEPFHNSDLDHSMGDELEFEQHDWYLELSKPNNPGAFFTYTPSIFFSLVNSIDTTLPTQLAKAQLYDVPVRPKLKWDMRSITSDKFLPLLRKYRKPKHLYQYKTTKSAVLNTFSAAFWHHSRYTNSAAYATINIGE